MSASLIHACMQLSSYHEHRETLSNEIKDMLNDLGEVKPNPITDNMLERFWTIDMVQCLC